MIPDAPHFSITFSPAEESNNEQASDFVIIDAMDTEDISCGFIVLDNPSDLYKLRAAIDGFIKHYNIQP